ncbi:MAG: Deoxycytidylate deaminase [Candidatus Methanohalarchaeum thermophilum]|uniref:Deoxycytidylate deaminase n=1 Tax=Methanohalarchaeum thermophilum TaxID=1903181 RepID=A0A1Q6DVC7_METT1|nr:MAG: Deoxycytidylate deaminase [Candidatus Methanohalarchaeum thermophilum]
MVRENKLEKRLLRFLKYIVDNTDIEPTPQEKRMALASSIALESGCTRRKVGAVIYDKNEDLISAGFNQIQGTPCKDMYKQHKCRRKYLRNEKDKYSDEAKLLDHCKAVHAEQNALLNVKSEQTQRGTIYVTTCPCFDCAKQIIRSGINELIYMHPYPNYESLELMENNGVIVRKFEGVRSGAFLRFFGEENFV